MKIGKSKTPSSASILPAPARLAMMRGAVVRIAADDGTSEWVVQAVDSRARLELASLSEPGQIRGLYTIRMVEPTGRILTRWCVCGHFTELHQGEEIEVAPFCYMPGCDCAALQVAEECRVGPFKG